jgi:putative phosphoribosyl transferase
MSNDEQRSVQIPIGSVSLAGDLAVRSQAQRIVMFAHGSGSSRLSPRNRFVAEFLRARGSGTLLMDLLTPEEDESAANRFDIELLSERLLGAYKWLRQQMSLSDLPVGLFGASTGSASALKLAATLGDEIGAVVSRGGRPDLAEEALAQVVSPTLLIVGGDDATVLQLNERALRRMRAVRKLEVIPGATHLFEEPGAIEQVAHLADAWFREHCG